LRLHAQGGVRHAAVDFELGELVPGVFLHGVEDGFGLEADGFEGGAGDVAALGVLGYADCCLEDCVSFFFSFGVSKGC
jgi:hypothetical protein